MTTIAFKDGVMACDGQIMSDNTIITMDFNKLTKLRNGFVVGVAGDARMMDLVTTYLRGVRGVMRGRRSATKSALSALNQETKEVVDQDPEGGYHALVFDQYEGLLFDFSGDFNGRFVFPRGDFTAIGSGANFALAVMMAGRPAREAVRIASRLDTNTGGTIRSVKCY